MPVEIQALLPWEETKSRSETSDIRIADGVAIIPIVGIMSAKFNLEMADLVKTVSERQDVEALCFVMETPGGAVSGILELQAAVANVTKPKVAYVERVCASAGYWAICKVDRIYAKPSAMVGSIGVYTEVTKYSKELLARSGISVDVYAENEGKVYGHSLVDTTDSEKAHFQSHVKALYDKFATAVADGRGLSREEVDALNSNVFMAEDTVGKLVDELV